MLPAAAWHEGVGRWLHSHSPVGLGNTQTPHSVPAPRDVGVQEDMGEDVAVLGGTTALPPHSKARTACAGVSG